MYIHCLLLKLYIFPFWCKGIYFSVSVQNFKKQCTKWQTQCTKLNRNGKFGTNG